MKTAAFLISLTFGAVCIASAEFQVTRDVEFAKVNGKPLQLDLYLPGAPAKKPPLIVYVHGGAWRGGGRSEMPLGKLVAEGFAVASVDYRLSTEAVFPAQIHDIKAAVRFLRAHESSYNYDASWIAVAGSSAGGHLAALVGVTNGVKSLEGTVGGDLGQSSDVQAIISYFGASNLQSILGQSTPHGLNVRVPALQLLLGGQPTEKPELARLASPVGHIDGHDPPLLLFHGDADSQMPIEQSYELSHAYESAGLQVRLYVLPGSKHGGKEFYDAERTKIATAFLRESIEKRPVK